MEWDQINRLNTPCDDMITSNENRPNYAKSVGGKQADVWTPNQLLEAWGLRTFGALTNPYKLSTGNRAATDDESQAAWYVEHTAGFELARDVLVWRYQKGRSLIDFPIRQPGETLVRALLRRCWGGMLGRPAYQIAQAIHDEFVNSLSDRLRREPFRPFRLREDDHDEPRYLRAG